MSGIHVGTCSWTDPTLIAAGSFYPKKDMSAEERLKFYAQNFDVVEVDATFYVIPSEKVVGLHTERTPDDFILHYKAFGLLTQHPIDPKRLPKNIKAMLPQEAVGKSRLDFRDVPPEARDMAFQMFESALRPADSAGKLGVLVFQFPPYFTHQDSNKEYILYCKERFPQYKLAVEFRHPSWLAGDAQKDTLEFLEVNSLSYVSVDEPQFEDGKTIPPIAQSTTDISYIRLHGRNRDNWFRRGIPTAERYAYHYSEEELKEWLPRIRELAAAAKETYVMFNNCYRDYAVNNARRMKELLG
jgi:uncharacterized protein YecE (DUF72 family)